MWWYVLLVMTNLLTPFCSAISCLLCPQGLALEVQSYPYHHSNNTLYSANEANMINSNLMLKNSKKIRGSMPSIYTAKQAFIVFYNDKLNARYINGLSRVNKNVLCRRAGLSQVVQWGYITKRERNKKKYMSVKFDFARYSQ